MKTTTELRDKAVECVRDLHNAYASDVLNLEEKLDKKKEEVEELEAELSRVREVYAKPLWGNCRRGCPPSYLDADSYCSPACHLGAPRGQYGTLPRELVIGVRS